MKKLFASVVLSIVVGAGEGSGAPLCCHADISSPASHRLDTVPDSHSDAYVPFCGVQRRATNAQITYVGNTGSHGHYGCNIMTISANTASMYDYTIRFINEGHSKQECKCWNKIGPTGGLSGFFEGNEAITFTLPVGGQQFVAFNVNSQIGCSCHADSVPLTEWHQFASTWVEADFGNQSNDNYTGFDASCLVAAKYGLAIPGLSVCGNGTCSIIHPGGTGDNAYVSGMEAVDGVGGNIAAGPVALTARIDTK